MKNYTSYIIPILYLLLSQALSDNIMASPCLAALPCQAYQRAAAVFVGTATEVSPKKVEIDTGEHKVAYNVAVTKFNVEQVLKGIDDTTAVIASDDYSFERDRKYLVYAYKDSKEGLKTGSCMRTRPFAEAEEDLEILRGIARGQAPPRLFGSLVRMAHNFERSDTYDAEPMVGMKISVEGEGISTEVITGASGHFHLLDMPPGHYTVRALLPDGYTTSYAFAKIEMPTGGCGAEANLQTEIDGRISGKVIDAKGKPVRGLSLRLLPVDAIGTAKIGILSMTSDASGHYEFWTVPPGRYLLGLNITGVPHPDAPYPPTYYPGVDSPVQAKTIVAGEGQRIENIDLRLLPLIIR